MPDIRLQDYVTEIRELIRNIRLDEAIAHSQHILRHFPKHIESYSLLGEACLEKEMYREAIEFFQRTLGADPENLIARVGLSVIYDEQGAFPEAIWQLERAFELVPGNAEVRRELLRLYSQYEGIDKTRLRLSRGALGRLYSRNGLYERAIDEFRAVLAQDPELPDIRVALIESLWREGRQVEAVEACLDLLDDLPHCLKANLILGDIWLRGGDEEAAEQRLNVARELDPENIVAQQLMGRNSPLPPEQVLLPELDFMPDELVPIPADGPVAEAMDTVALGGPDDRLPWDADEELPEWLRDVGVTAEEPPSDLTAKDAVLEPPPDEALPTEEMPEWLQEVMGEEGRPAGSESVAGEEEVIAGEEEFETLVALESLMEAEAEDLEPVEPEIPDEVMPEWLQELVGKAETPSAEEPEPDLEEASAPPAAVDEVETLVIEEEALLEEEALPEDETPDWLRDLEKAGVEEVTAPPAGVDEEDLLVLEEKALAEDEIPDWLRDLDKAEVQEVTAPPAAVDEEDLLVLEEKALPEDEIPEWLRDLGVDDVEEALVKPPVAEGETPVIAEPLVGEKEDLPDTEEEVPVIDQIPDWLREFEEAEELEIAGAPFVEIEEEASEEDQVPASLLALVAAGLLDEADLESAMAEMSDEELSAQRAEEVPGWLSELIAEETTVTPEPEPEPEPVIEGAVAEVEAEPEPELVVEEAMAEVKPEPEPELVIEEAMAEIEPEPELVIEEAVVEVGPEPEPEPVVEEFVAEVEPEPEPELVIEEAMAEIEPEPELVVEEAMAEVEAEPELELVVEEAMAEVEPEPEPEPVIEEAMTEIEPEPEPEPVIEEAMTEIEPEPEPEPVIEEAVAEVEPGPEPEPVVEEAVVEVEAEPDLELVVEEAVVEVEAEPEPEPVIEETVIEVEAEPEPELVIEESVAEVEAEPEPEPVIEETVVEAEPEPVIEESVAEVEAEPEPELVIEESVAEVEAEPEPEPVVEEAVAEVAPERLDELMAQLKRRPRDYSARLELARLHYADQDWDRALTNYEKLISARRFLPDVVDDLESLLDQAVEPARVYHMLGDAYMQQDQLDEALEMYRLARQKLTRR